MSDTKKDKKTEQDQVPNGTHVASVTDPAEEAAKKIVAEAEAKAAEIVAAAEEKARAKSEAAAKNTSKAEASAAKTRPGEELVEYTAPLLPGQERQDIVVGINGEIIRIRRGESVTIKRKFVNAINDSARQQVEAHRASSRAQKVEKMYDL